MNEQMTAQEKAAEHRRAQDARLEVRASDLEPYVGLRYLSKLFRLMAVILVLLLIALTARWFVHRMIDRVTRRAAEGLPTPDFMVLQTVGDARFAAERFGYPFIIKPAADGSSVGVSKVKAFEQIEKAFDFRGHVTATLADGGKIEGYLFIAMIYFTFCFAMSRYSLWVEKQVNKGKQR